VPSSESVLALRDTTRPAALEAHRRELTGYCYRMLGGAFEAEDAVQEAFVKAWKTFDPARGSLRSWLYKIATKVCLDMLRSTQRRAVPMDLAAPAVAGSPLGDPLPPSAWVQPMPDARVLPADEVAAGRETVRLAFVAALQHLPPRQRAVLILRDVLDWSAAEVADLLDTTLASVNSALQRARGVLAARRPTPLQTPDPDLVERYTTAFERHDIATLVALLHEDATMAMPPFAWWLRGRWKSPERSTRRVQAARRRDCCQGGRTAAWRSDNTDSRTASIDRSRSSWWSSRAHTCGARPHSLAIPSSSSSTFR
jgi:RNA polymerase sigma-70 factor, ECF subfamily